MMQQVQRLDRFTILRGVYEPLRIFLVWLLVAGSCSLRALSHSSLSTELTLDEQDQLQARLELFYGSDTPHVMSLKIPKVNVATGRAGGRGEISVEGSLIRNPSLKELAGAKSSPKFVQTRKHWFQKRFPRNGANESWSSYSGGDRVSDLLESYFDESEISYDLDKIPNRGEISRSYWSGDYWSMNSGLTSYRYSTEKAFELYQDAITSYLQPEEWSQLWGSLPPNKWSEEVQKWSPSEKYDLLVGDENFTLTKEQKGEGADFVNSEGKVESWFGICDGWAPASVFVPTPNRSIKTLGARGVSIPWYPDDVRALASLAWSNGDYPNNFVGRRCEVTTPKVYKNGRISDEDCADTNPATFHLALGFLLGKKGIPFIMDASFDAEVWNQPILAYEIRYFNPLNPRQRSFKWRDVSVPYDEAFKTKDRFQKPLTRGYRRAQKYFDGAVKAIVGVQTTLVYLAEYEANSKLQPQENVTERVTYTYDLELHEKEGALVPLGGEWHSNAHPDFLWLPQNHAVATGRWDKEISKFELSSVVPPALSEVAAKASKNGYPLCSVIESLVKASSEGADYQCPRN